MQATHQRLTASMLLLTCALGNSAIRESSTYWRLNDEALD